MKIVLKRIDNRVYYGEKELKINEQKTKGPGKEVIDISSIGGDDYQKWLSLSLLKEGDNEIELKDRRTNSILNLTEEEKLEIAKLEKQIEEIKDKARERKPIDLKKLDPSKMTQDEKLKAIEMLQDLINKMN